METLGPRAGLPPDAAGLEKRALEFLERRRGLPICQTCLAHELEARNPLLMLAVWRSLVEKVEQRIVQIEGTCSRCFRSIAVIYASVV